MTRWYQRATPTFTFDSFRNSRYRAFIPNGGATVVSGELAKVGLSGSGPRAAGVSRARGEWTTVILLRCMCFNVHHLGASRCKCVPVVPIKQRGFIPFLYRIMPKIDSLVAWINRHLQQDVKRWCMSMICGEYDFGYSSLPRFIIICLCQPKQRSVVGRLLLSVPLFMHKLLLSIELRARRFRVYNYTAIGQWSGFGRKEEAGLPVAKLLRVDKARLKRGEFRNLLLRVSLEAYALVRRRFMEGDAAIRCAA